MRGSETLGDLTFSSGLLRHLSAFYKHTPVHKQKCTHTVNSNNSKNNNRKMYLLVQKLSNTEGYLSQDSIYIMSVQQAKPMGKKTGNRKII